MDSGLIMFPSGHARNTSANLEDILNHKFNLIGRLAINDSNSLQEFLNTLNSLDQLDNNSL